MRFALRDDDLNYYFTPSMIEEYYKHIWDFCPVSMSVVPFIKGNWPKALEVAEKMGPGIMSEDYLKKRIADNKVFPIDENTELVDYIRDQLIKGRIYLTIHAIHHRNEDDVIPQFKNNYGLGAEFYTKRDLTTELKNAISYLERTFSQKIEVFTPPQNKLSKKGLRAVLNNGLAICGGFPSMKSTNTVTLLGLINYLKILKLKLKKRKYIYPYVIKNNKISLVAYHNLQPTTDIGLIKQEIDHASEQNGVFVLATHSYAFNYLMKGGNQRMGEALIEIINYAKEKSDIEFVSLNKIFE